MADQGLVEADHLNVVVDRDALIGSMETQQILGPRARTGENRYTFSATPAIWRESVPPITNPGATTTPGNISRTVCEMSA